MGERDGLARRGRANHQQRHLHAAPMFHLADGAMINSGTIIGAMHAVIPSFTPEGVLQAIEHYRVMTCCWCRR